MPWAVIPGNIGESPLRIRPYNPPDDVLTPGELVVESYVDDAVLAADGKSMRPRNTIEQFTEQREQRMIALKRLRDAISFASFRHGGYWYECDATSRLHIAGRALKIVSGLPVEYPFQWTDTGNNLRTFNTGDEFLAFAAGLDAFVAAVHANYAVLKAALAAAGDPSTVDIEQGWPDNLVLA